MLWQTEVTDFFKVAPRLLEVSQGLQTKPNLEVSGLLNNSSYENKHNKVTYFFFDVSKMLKTIYEAIAKPPPHNNHTTHNKV